MLVLAELQSLESHAHETITVFALAMTSRLSDLRVSLLAFKKTLIERTSPTYDSQPFDTGNSIPLLLEFNIVTISLGRFFNDLHGKHISSLFAILNVTARNLFGHASRQWCNVNLRSHKLFMEKLHHAAVKESRAINIGRHRLFGSLSATVHLIFARPLQWYCAAYSESDFVIAGHNGKQRQAQRLCRRRQLSSI